MQTHRDKSVTLSRIEVKSLRKMLNACSTMVTALPSGEDVIGWEHHYALGMWESKLKGEDPELSWYIDTEDDDDDEEEEEDDDDGNEQFAETPKKPTTVDEWLFDYGAGYR